MDIAKLFILDENETEVGRLVLDMDKLITMYQAQKIKTENAKLTPDDFTPQDEDDEFVEIAIGGWAWFRKPNGSIYLVQANPKT